MNFDKKILVFLLFVGVLSPIFAVLNPQVRDDPYEFYYSSTDISGTITVERNPGARPETLSIQSAKIFTRFPKPPDGIYEDRLVVAFAFKNTNIEVRAYLRWNGQSWEPSMVEGDPESDFLGVGHDRDELDYTQFGYARVNEYELDVQHDSVGEIRRIQMQMGDESLGYFGQWIKADVHRVLDFSVTADFKTDYYVIPVMGHSQFTPLEARYLDTGEYQKRISPSLLGRVFLEPEEYLPQLVNVLLKGVQDDFLAIKILHDWVTKNIYYDLECFQGGRNNCPTDPFGTVLNRKSVCEGYAKLMEQLGKYAHLPIFAIGGFTKGGGFYTEGQLSRHAYNIVYVNNQWLLLDATHDTGNYWEAGVFYDGAQSNNKLFVPMEYTWWYYYPYRPQYQFRDPVTSFEEFQGLNQTGMNLSYVNELGPNVDLRVLGQLPWRVSPVDKPFEFVVEAPVNTKFTFTFNSDVDPRAKGSIFSSYDGTLYHFYVAPPGPEPYRIYMLYRSSDMEKYSTFGALYVEPKTQFEKPFPKSYWDWSNRGGHILGEIVSSVIPGEDFELRVVLPKATGASILEPESKTRWQMKQNGQEFFVKIKGSELLGLKGRLLRLYVTYSDISYGKALLEWPIGVH